MPSRAMRAKTSPLRGSRRRTVPCRSPPRTADPGQSSRRQRASPAFRSGPGASADPSFNLARHAAGGGGRTRQFAPASFAAASALQIAQIAPAHSAGLKSDETGKTSSLALLARLEPSLDFRFSLIALGRRGEKASRAARLRPAQSSNTARGFACRRGQNN